LSAASERSGVVAEGARDLRLLDRLRRAADQPRDHDRRHARPFGGAAHGELQHRLEQSGLADRELGGVDADREAARAGVEIIARERALAAAVELAIGGKRERMRRDHHALAQRGEHLRRPILPVRRHELVSRACPDCIANDNDVITSPRVENDAPILKPDVWSPV
jgi:hypothetical protein